MIKIVARKDQHKTRNPKTIVKKERDRICAFRSKLPRTYTNKYLWKEILFKYYPQYKTKPRYYFTNLLNCHSTSDRKLINILEKIAHKKII
tara:strand:+ start:1650 stop:1922 length:273 start_codon:yes stop_codon:yes gene_type:complete